MSNNYQLECFPTLMVGDNTGGKKHKTIVKIIFFKIKGQKSKFKHISDNSNQFTLTQK